MAFNQLEPTSYRTPLLTLFLELGAELPQSPEDGSFNIPQTKIPSRACPAPLQGQLILLCLKWPVESSKTLGKEPWSLRSYSQPNPAPTEGKSPKGGGANDPTFFFGGGCCFDTRSHIAQIVHELSVL